MKLIITALALLAGTAFSAPGHWYTPDRDGLGLQIDQNFHGFGHAVTWYLYREDGSGAFLVGGETCPYFPCVVELHEPTANYMGGGLELGPAIGILEIGIATEGVLQVDYDLRAWLAAQGSDRCENISVGGILFRECAGKIDLQLLTD